MTPSLGTDRPQYAECPTHPSFLCPQQKQPAFAPLSDLGCYFSVLSNMASFGGTNSPLLFFPAFLTSVCLQVKWFIGFLCLCSLMLGTVCPVASPFSHCFLSPPGARLLRLARGPFHLGQGGRGWHLRRCVLQYCWGTVAAKGENQGQKRPVIERIRRRSGKRLLIKLIFLVMVVQISPTTSLLGKIAGSF